MKSRRILAPFFLRSWPLYAAGIALHLLANAVNVFYPTVLGNFTDSLQAGSLSLTMIGDCSLTLLGIGAGHAAFHLGAMYSVMYAGRRFEFQMRNTLFQHFTELSERFYAKNGVGKLLSYFMNDVTQVREAISMGANSLANAVMMLAAAFVMMMINGIPVWLITVSIAPLLLTPWVVSRIGPIIRQRSMLVQQALGAMTEMAEEQFGGVRVTKKFAVEPIMNRRFGDTVEDIRRHQLRLVRVSSLFQALVPWLGSISLIAALAVGGYAAIQGHMTLGQFVALTLYIRMLMNPLQQIGNVINSIQRARASLQRLRDLLSERPDIVEHEQAIALDLRGAAIEFDRLTFRYDDSGEVLRDIDWTIRPGATVGIVGRTGSGKTTLMKLLLRICDPPPGTIRIGDVDVRALTLDSLRRQIGYVPQDSFLFSTSIRDNIAFSDRGVPDETVAEAARHAQLYDTIAAMPERFSTRLGERGLTLSGGQRQRASLARGWIKEAPVMILDDSVSAVDAVTEADIIETVRGERQGKTTIIIAHRLSALKHADDIIVLNRGRIVQRGTHRELLAQPGLYATLYAIQEEGSAHAATASHS